MEGPTSIPKGRKRPSSMSAEGQAQKKFQDDCCANETGTEEAVVYATPPLVRQGTFTKNDCDADQEASQDRHAEQFYILVEQAGSTTRGEVLRRRLADRAAQISEGSRKARTERRAKEAQPRTQPRGTLSSTSRGDRGYCRTQGSSSASCRSSRGGGRVNSSPKSATPSPPQLQRQGTFTVDEEDADSGGRRSGTEELANPTDTAPDQGAEVRPETVIQSESHIPDAEVDPRPGGSACSAFSGGDTVAAVTASESNMAETECSNLSSVAELRAALAALRRGRAAAERSERAARERAARDAAKTRAALQDLQARLAATREALLSEKDALNRKLSAGFRKALHDRESLWRQDRERTQAQVRALEAEARSLRAQLHSAHAQAHADAQRKATANEADLRRACHDQESSLRSQVAELVKQRDSLQAQLRDRAAHDATERFRDDDQWRRALRREQQEARRKQAILQQQLTEVQQALARSARSAPVTCGTDLAFSLHNNEECERKLSEAASRQQALEDELQAALRALHAQDQGDSRFQSKQVALALETHGEGEREGEGRRDEVGLQEEISRSEEWRTPHFGENLRSAGFDFRQQPARKATQQRKNKRKRGEEEEEGKDGEEKENMDLERRLNETNDDEKRRRLLYEVERLRVTNVELKVALRLQSWRRRARKKNCAGPQPRRVRRAASRPSGQKKISAPSSREQCPLHQLNGHHGEQEELQDAPSASTAPAAPATEESPVDASRHTNAGGRGEEGPMRHFHKLISLEPVSEADEHPGGGEGGGLGGLGGSLMGSESPLSSGPSSLSPTPGIGDVWNDLVPSSGGSGLGSGPSSGSSSPGGESLGGSPGASLSPEQLGSHPVLYWQLMRDHLQLQRAYQQLQQLQASSRSNDRQARAKLEAQVYDLKRALSRRSASSGSALNDALQDVAELRQREESLIAELAELRDQNELLEFRLLELEGIVDKSSVCSGTRDVCTDTESDTVTEDSGLLSLGASDDGEAIDSTAVRERLALLASSMQTEADRGCLQRALQLLDNYQQHFGKDASVKASPPSSAAKQPNQRIVATVLPFTEAAIDVETDDTKLSSREEFRRKQEFFNQMQRLGHLHHSNTGSNNTKKSLKQSDCLQESGIFEGDSEDGVVSDLASRATQTEEIQTCSCHQQDSEDSPLAVDTEIPFSSLPAFVSPKKTPPEPAAAGALSEEIQKLSQIRERIEEQGTVSKLKLPEAAPVALPGVGSAQLQLKLCELEFFRSRAAALEAKLAELERCSDPELRGCARLLERVAALERQAREARESADMLVRRNRDLEEERCELEEAENDTRLRCQQLEVEVVQLREREGALELELGRARRSLSDAHQLQGRLEMALQSLETRNFELEEAECELRASIAAVESALPATVAFHLAHYKHYLQMRERPAQTGPNSVCSVAVSTEDPNEPDTTEEDAEAMEQDAVIPAAKRDDSDVLERLAQLMAAEKDMHQKIAFLEQKESAFQETLAAADGLWTEMELNYKRRLARAEEAEEELRSKVRRLEDSECKLRQAVSEQTALSERVAELEVQERALVSRIRTLEQDKQSVSEEAARRHDDLKAARAALAALQERVQGPIAQELAAERRRADELAEELRGRQDVLVALEQRASIEISALQAQITAGEKTLQDMEVTCAELREEVDTLEEAVSSLRNELSVAHDKAERHLFHMESAVADRDRLLDQLKLLEAHPTAALHHEMAVAAASRQPEEDDETSPSPPVSFAPAAVSFRKSLQAFRSCETKASKPPTPPKPVPKKEAGQVAPFTSLPTMPTATASKKTPPPLPPKITTSVKWQRADNSSPCGS